MKKNAKIEKKNKKGFCLSFKNISFSVKEIVLIGVIFILSLTLIYSIFNPFNSYAEVDNSNGDYTSVVGPVYNGTKFEEKFIVKLNEIDTVSIYYANYATLIDKGSFNVKIYNEKDELIFLNDYNLNSLSDNIWINFNFDPVKNSAGKEFRIVIEVKDFDEEIPITFYKGEDNTSIEILDLASDEIEFGGSLLIKQTGENSSYYITFVIFFILLICSFVLGFFRSENYTENKIVKILLIIISIALSLIMSVSLIILDIKMFDSNNFRVLPFGLFVATSLILVFLIGYYSSHKFKPEKLFLSLAIPFGLLYMFCIAPGQVPDEEFHYKMANQVATGNFMKKESTVEYLKVYGSYEEVKWDLDNVKSMPEVNSQAGGYSFLLYLGSGLGIFIGKVLGLHIIYSILLGMFMNYLVFLISGYLIIKYLPFGKYMAIVYMLNPMYLQQATSLSGDAIINASSLLLISYVLYIRFKKQNIDTKSLIFLLLLSLFVFNSKFAYFPLIFIMLIIIKYLKDYCIKNKKVFIFLITIFILLMGSSLLLFTGIKQLLFGTSNLHNSINNVILPQSEMTKLQYVLTSPTKLIYLIFNTLHNYFDFYVKTFAGGNLLWFTLPTPSYLQSLFYILLIISVFFDNSTKEFKKSEKLFLWLITILNIIVIFIGLMSHLYPRYLFIQGVQGRYFIPILIIPLLLLNTKKVKINISDSTKKIIISVLICFINIYTLFFILNFF